MKILFVTVFLLGLPLPVDHQPRRSNITCTTSSNARPNKLALRPGFVSYRLQPPVMRAIKFALRYTR